MVDVELDLPLGLLTRIDDDQVQVAVRPSSALGPRSEKDDLLGMDRFGDDLHHTLDHWIGDHAWPRFLKMSTGAGASKAAPPRGTTTSYSRWRTVKGLVLGASVARATGR